MKRKLFGIEKDLMDLWRQDLSVDELVEEICFLAEKDKFFSIATPRFDPVIKKLVTNRTRLRNNSATLLFWEGFDDGMRGHNRVREFAWHHKPMLEFLYLAGFEMASRHPEWRYVSNYFHENND